MRVVGNPEISNMLMMDRIRKISKFSSEVINLDEVYFSRILKPQMNVLDVGMSLRDKFEMVSQKVASCETLDINLFENYPDVQMDLCESVVIPPDLKYDVIFCFSLLEHCYNPFIASENLFEMLKPRSKIIGSVPFLFPHHCPEDLSYQDYFRFTKHSFISLFPKATRIEVSPHRGRVGAGLNIISQRYKDLAESKFPLLTKKLNRIDQNRKPEQSSGFHFEVFN